VPEIFDSACNGFVPRERERWDPCFEPLRVRLEPSASLDRGTAQPVLTLSGELDLATAPQLAETLGEASGTVLIDCRSLSFIDAAGIRVLENALNHLDGVHLVNVGSRVRRVITIVGLEGKLLDRDR